MSEVTAKLYYIHDPMCSWCWAFRPRLLEIRENLPGGIAWQNVLGGLAPDSDVPMPEATRQMVQAHWRKIEATTETVFNFDFWTKCQPRRDTYKSCRAVIAAENQQAGERMIEAIQKAYYLRAMNPSEPAVLVSLAEELGLDRKRFESDFVSVATEQALQADFALRRSLGVRSFPSLVLQKGDQVTQIRHDYGDSGVSLKQIDLCQS